MFLRALGRDIDAELQQLAGRATFGVGELTSDLRERCQLLEKTVDHFCDVVAPPGWTASASTEEEVEVILPPCSGTLAEFRIAWPKSSTTDDRCTRDNYGKARFFALTVAYAMKLGGTLSRDTGDQEILSVEMPIADHAEHQACATTRNQTVQKRGLAPPRVLPH